MFFDGYIMIKIKIESLCFTADQEEIQSLIDNVLDVRRWST